MFEGYKAAGDPQFVKYMDTLETGYENGWNGLGNLTPQKLNSLALDKYNTLFGQKVWRKKTAAEQQLVAMNAEIDRLREESGRLKGQLKLKKRTPPKGKQQRTPKTKNKKPSTNKSRQKQDEAHKKVPPKDGEPHVKTINGRTAKWCIHHMAWGGHSSDECRLGQQRKAEQLQARSATTSDSASTIQGLEYLAAVASAASRDE